MKKKLTISLIFLGIMVLLVLWIAHAAQASNPVELRDWISKWTDGPNAVLSGLPMVALLAAILGAILAVVAWARIKRKRDAACRTPSSREVQRPKAGRVTAPKKFGEDWGADDADTQVEEESDNGLEQTPMPGASDIKSYFLNVFRVQLGAGAESPPRIEQISGEDSGSEKVYRLYVQHHGEWKSRGMSIASLGDDKGNKSRCYYVIFDTHMVIKIPRKPVADFNEYVRGIRYEGRIARKLAPRQCIISNLWVILSKLKLLSAAEGLPEEELEQKCLSFLKLNPQYHKYLRIGGRFAFFLNLSQYYFLSHVLLDLHETEKQIREIMTLDAALFQDCNEFESKHGSQQGWVCLELQRIYRHFDKRFQDISTKTGHWTPITERQKKTWFFAYLTLEELPAQGGGCPPALEPEIQMLLYDTTSQETETITAYRRLVREQAQALTHLRSRQKMECIITNLLDLLAWMGKNNVAMRDLKPDNLFVAGIPENYPQFLSATEEFTIGLIDLETAIDYGPSENASLEQPSLGGTPAYATPSHFFPNQTIQTLFEDLPLILHMQDWYATTAIIFEVVTGERLFNRTTQLIFNLVTQVNECSTQNSPLEDIYREDSRLFWETAAEELNTKIKRHQRWLGSTAAVIPDSLSRHFKEFLVNMRLKSDQRIADCIKSEDGFGGAEAKEYWLRCPYAEIRRAIEEHRTLDAAVSGKECRSNFIDILENLADLKRQSAHYLELGDLLDNPSGKLSIKDLIEVMFSRVVSAMYPEAWKPLFPLLREPK
jgi:serine/threonine protein kinase